MIHRIFEFFDWFGRRRRGAADAGPPAKAVKQVLEEWRTEWTREQLERRHQTLRRIAQIAKEMGKPSYDARNYPSGYWIEFPAAVEAMEDTQGPTAADAYIRRTFARGDCQDAFDRAYG